jgi:hypothetical protein
MRHFAFFISTAKPANDNYSFPLPGVGKTGIRWASIRILEVPANEDPLTYAFDHVRQDESVMNTHGFED